VKRKFDLFIYFLKKDIKARYAGSGFGLLWAILIPLAQIALFWFVFSGIMKARPYSNTQVPYIYFLLSSFFFWLAFSEGIIRSSSIIIENAEIIKKIPFPNILLPITVISTSYLLNFLGFVFFLIIYTISTGINPLIILVIPIILFQFIFSIGIGIFIASIVPYVRDINQILGYILQGMFFLSPIIYSIESVPERFKTIFYLNPITYFASSYHKIILLREMPPFNYLITIIISSSVVLLVGYYTFKKLKEGFADVL
jgi:ABC-type polysaccharide/polyol phosphate export permease